MPRWLRNLAWPSVFAALIVYGLWLLRGGYLHYEGAFFLSAFVDDRSLFAKIFSSHVNQWNCYLGRELSFVFGFLDAEAIVLAARLGGTALYSATNVIAFLLTGVFLWKTLPLIAPRLSANQSGLIVSLMLTTPVFALSTYYYRPAKALSGFFLVLLVRELSGLFSEKSQVTDGDEATTVHPARIFLFALLMAMSDPLGTAFIVLAGLVVVVKTWPGARARPALVSLVLAVLVNSGFGLVGAKLSTIVDGFSPDTVNRHILLRYTFADPHNYLAALTLWRDQIGYFLGNWGMVASASFVVIAATAAWRVSAAAQAHPLRLRRDVLVVVGTVGILLLMYVVMYAKLTSITWPESRRVYYWIPTTVSIAIAVAIGASRIVSAWPAAGKILTLVLVAMLCTNILALPGHRDIVFRGEQHIAIEQAPRVRECMRAPDRAISEFGLSAEGAQACGSVRIAAFGSIGQGSVPAPAVPNPLLYCRKTGRR